MNKSWLFVLPALLFLAGCAAPAPGPPDPAAPPVMTAHTTAVPLRPTASPLIPPTPTSIPPQASDEPTVDSDWALYENLEYGFEFRHPSLNGECCRMEGPAYGEIDWMVTFAREETVLYGTDKPFDGFSVHVVENSEALSLSAYLELEIAAQKALYETRLGEPAPEEGTQEPFILDGQEGWLVAGYAWDGNERIYVPFPESQRILAITIIEAQQSSFSDTFACILHSFQFL